MRRHALLALSAVAALTLVGCTEVKGEYATPSELCGVPVDPSVLEPVLLPGESLTMSSANSNAQNRRCDVSVDGERVLSLEGRLGAPSENYRATWDWQMPQGTEADIGDEARSTDTVVGAARKCAVKGQEHVFVARAERFYPKKDDAAGRKEAMVRFMTSYFPAAQKAFDCTG